MGRNPLELTIAVLNGAVGDYLAARGNGLSTPMSLVDRGKPLPLTQAGLQRHTLLGPRLRAEPPTVDAPLRLVVFVHGLMCTEDIWDFPNEAPGSPPRSYGSRLHDEGSFIPLVLRYNTGLAIADNGRLFDAWLEGLLRALSESGVERGAVELSLVGYSMGGLVVRSACRRAEGRPTDISSGWLSNMRRCVYVGTPHQGAPLERFGRGLTRLLAAIPDPIVTSVGELIDARSRGVKDLGDAVLSAEHDGRGQRGAAFPLTPGIAHYLIAGSLVRNPQIAELLGDLMVPLPSGSDGHEGLAPRTVDRLPPDHVAVLFGKSHVDVAHDEAAYQALRGFFGLSDPSAVLPHAAAAPSASGIPTEPTDA